MSLTQGSQGRPVQIATNSFAVSRLPTKPYYHYDVVTQGSNDGAREVTAGRRTTDIIEAMKDRYASNFKSLVSFDGAKNLFTTDKLSNGTFNIQMGQNPDSKRGKYVVRLTLVSKIDPADIEKLISSRGADAVLTPNNTNTIVLTLLQVILSQGPQRQHNFSLHSKSFYIPSGSKQLSGGLVGWKGFFQSVRATAGKIIVNVDTTAAAFYKASDLMSSALEVLRCREVRELNRLCATPQPFQKLRSFFKGVIVMVPGNRRKKIIDLVPRAGHEEFIDKEGNKITVAEYWASHYNKALRFADAFGIKLTGGAIFPAEVCEIVPGQRYKRRLSPEDTTAFMQLSVSKPDTRISAITDAVQNNLFDYNHSPYMIDAGMRVDPRPLTLTGRELQAPRVLYGSGSLNVRGGAWNLVSQTLRQPTRITAWAVVVFDTGPGLKERVDAFCVALAQQMQNLGMRIDRGPHKEIGNAQNVEESLKTAGMQAVRGLPPLPDGTTPKPSFILVILPQNGDEIREIVKHWGDATVGIPTQCVKAGKYDKERGRDQYCGNVALKINARTGGVNSYVQPQTVTEFLKDSMIVGCDVTHPAPGVSNRPSVASLVASYDESATRYRAYLDAQPPRQELITSIVGMLDAALQSYYRRRNKQLPKTVVIYRDGVSEGEYAKVHQEEIMKIEAHLSKTFKVPPQLIFIVVGKRHHVRFFPQAGQGDRSGNCHPGLVVDNSIVHSKLMDFYLQSHGGLLGTSRPSHYVVLRNGPQWTADQLQELSYALCFVYASATRSVSIPAPVYYADKACTRAQLQFDPALRYAEDSSNDTQFDLDKWKKGLIQSALAAQMYFI